MMQELNKRINNDDLVIDDKTASLLEKVYETFGQFSAGKLTEMSQKEKPFIQTAKCQVIDCKKIKKYFKKHYIEREKE